MDKLSAVIESLTKPRYEEDSIDRLNYHVTTLILLLAAFAIIAKEYGGDPIQCWLPAELASQKSWEQYAEGYCFVENTYYIPLEQNIPQSVKHREEKMITYYQWVPFTLMLQAFSFVIPHVFWRMLNWTSNIQTRAVISMADSVRQMNPCGAEANNIVDSIAYHIYHVTKSTKHLKKILQKSNLLVILTRIFTESYLSTIYLITKLLFVGNAIIQFWIVSLYLGGNGYELTKALLKRQTWKNTGLFPRVTMCDFKQPKKVMTCHYIEMFIKRFIGDTTLVLRLVMQNAGELIASNIAARLFDILVDEW
ncbi:Innexin [Dirofilaria immitis]|nr:Innexin [Dirofilaria immitis]